MKTLITLLSLVILFGCINPINNNGDGLPTSLQKVKTGLPDLIIAIDNYTIHTDSIEIFLRVQNIGGSDFSHTTAIIITYLDDGIEKGFYSLNNLDSKNEFFIRQVIYTTRKCGFMFTTIDKPLIPGGVSEIGSIIESNENNNTSSIIECHSFNTIIYTLSTNDSTGLITVEYSDFQGNFIRETVFNSTFRLFFVPKNINSKFIFRARSNTLNDNSLMVIAIRFENKIRIIETVLGRRPISEVVFDNREVIFDNRYIF